MSEILKRLKNRKIQMKLKKLKNKFRPIKAFTLKHNIYTKKQTDGKKRLNGERLWNYDKKKYHEYTKEILHTTFSQLFAVLYK